MDDGMLGDEMTLDGIGRQLTAIQKQLVTITADVSGLKADVSGLKADVSGLKADVSGLKQQLTSTREELGGEIAEVRAEVKDTRRDLSGQMLSVLNRVDGLGHDMKVQFEDTHGLLRFGLEAREALRETMESRFAEADRKHDEQIALLKDVLRAAR